MAGSWLFVSTPDISDKLSPLCEWKCATGGGGEKIGGSSPSHSPEKDCTHIFAHTRTVLPVTSAACKNQTMLLRRPAGMEERWGANEGQGEEGRGLGG